MNKYKATLTKHNFMNDEELNYASVADFIYRMSRDKRTAKRLDDMFDEFIMLNLEDMQEREELSIDTILTLVAIDSLTSYMKKRFMALVSIDHAILAYKAQDLLLDVLCGADELFFKYGKRP